MESVESAYVRLIDKSHFSRFFWLFFSIYIVWGLPGAFIACGVFPPAGVQLISPGTSWALWGAAAYNAFIQSICFFGILFFFLKKEKKDFTLIFFGKYSLRQNLFISIALGLLLSAFTLSRYDSLLTRNPDFSFILFGQAAITPLITIIIVPTLLCVPLAQELLVQFFVQTKLQKFGTTISIIAATILPTSFYFYTQYSYGSSFPTLPLTDVIFWGKFSLEFLIYALLRRYTGSMLAPMLCHAVFNAITLLIVILMSNHNNFFLIG